MVKMKFNIELKESALIYANSNLKELERIVNKFIDTWYEWKTMLKEWENTANDYERKLRDGVRKGQPAGFKVRYPIAFHTVDAAITRGEGDQLEVLLIQKQSEVDTQQWRFPGGFVDPSDLSAEYAVKREATEEVGGFETDKPQYITSVRIDDPRYRDSEHKIITSFFELPYLWGAERAGDDAAKAKWHKVSDLYLSKIKRNPIHEDLFQALFKRKGLV